MKCLAILFLSLASIEASPVSWSGTTDSHWSTATNWSGGVAPVNGDNVIFTGGSNLNTTNDLTGLSLASVTGFSLCIDSAASTAIAGNPLSIFGGSSGEIGLFGAGAHTIFTDLVLKDVGFFIQFNGTNKTISGVMSGIRGAGGPDEVAFRGQNDGDRLNLTGANTFEVYQTILDRGDFQVNSLGNADEAGSLGKSPLILAGVLDWNATINYVGAGNSTDRKILFGRYDGANDTGSLTLLNNGTGALVFTADTLNHYQGGYNVVANRIFTLGGNNTDNNEIRSVITNNKATGAGTGFSDTAGTIGIKKQDGGLWILSGNNSYTGGTTVSAGTLRIRNDSALGFGALTLNGGTFASASSSDRNLSNNLVIGGTAGLGETGTGTGALTFSGAVKLAGIANIVTVNSPVTLIGEVSGAALTKGGGGTLTLNGSNTYTGLTTVSDGILVVSNTTLTATITSNSVSVSFASTPTNGNYPILAGPVAGASLAGKSVTVAGGGSVTNASITNSPNLAVVVGAAPVITSATNVSGIIGSPFTYQITADNSPSGFAASGLPSELSLNAQTGLISGTPTTPVFSGSFTVTASNSLGVATQSIAFSLVHASEGVQGDFSSAPETPSSLGAIFSGQTVLGSVGGSDPADYLTFSVPAGYRLQSMRLRYYQTSDTTGTISIDEGTTWTAGDNVSAMLGSASFWAGDVGADLLTTMQVAGSALDAGTYTLRVQRSGAVAAYGFEFKLIAVGAPSGEITANPSTVFLLSGQLGTSIISWTTTGFANAEVYVYTDSNPAGQLFGRAPSAAGGPANWITEGRILFRLYGGLTRTELLDEVVVTGAPSPLRLAGVFGNDMVLQRDASVPVWGWAEPGQPVQVVFAGQTKSTTSGADGRWLVRLDPMVASTTGRTMQVTSSGATLTRTNVLVGEVWVLSGQSNMEWNLTANSETDAIARANYPWLRTFTIGWPFGTQTQPTLSAYRSNPATDVTAPGTQWSVISPANAGHIYTVGFYFAESLRQALGSGVPVGLIQAAIGSTSGECWVGKATRDANPALQYIGTEVWPTPPANPWFVDKFVMYHALIAPLQPYGIRGVLWYQGEGNTYQGEPYGGPTVSHYHDLLTGLIEGWRRDWNQGDFPFFIVQLPKYGATKVPWDSWELVREAQLNVSQELPNTGLAISIDTGTADPHPPDKQPIGERLARLARAKVHGEAILPTGPIYAGGTADNTGVNLVFANAGSGLQSSGGVLRTFEVAGSDGVFQPATATITGPDIVRVTSPTVPRIVFVRYGWDWSPDCNLVNSDQLPASPFRAEMSGTLAASPSKITLAPGTTGSTTLNWNTSLSPGAQVTRSFEGGAEQTFGASGSAGGVTVSGVGVGRTIFRLYGDPERSQLLDTVEVVGTTAPLTVQSDGSLRLNNRPFTGIGVNYYSAFERVLDNAADTSYEAGFETLGRWGVPFARLDFSGYWPSKTALFFTNRAEYFRRLDGVVASAERHGVGLVPSLFWTTFGFPDLAGEHLDQMAVSNSVTRQKMREFATEVVNRYKDSPAIWAWEFSNEWNLALDLPNYTDYLPTDPSLGNPATRDPVRDAIVTDTILPAMVEIATLIKNLDPGRPISTGHAMSQPFQWHLDQWKRGLVPTASVYTTDSPAQAEAIALRHCPDPFDLLSIHVYGVEPARVPDFAGFAARAGKALFVGEFGTPPNLEANYAGMLATVRAYAPLAAVWAFDRNGDEYNITTTNARNWMLKANLPSSFSSWSRGWSRGDLTGPGGETAFDEYVFGAPRPGTGAVRSVGGLSGGRLSLEAIVRTNDPSLTIFGESSLTLAPGSWTSEGCSSVPSTDQSAVLPGCERRIISVPADSVPRKFLRLRAQSP